MLQQKGYDFFQSLLLSSFNKSKSFSGSIQDNYVLNIGDEIKVILQGAETEVLTKRLEIGTIFPYLEPLTSWQNFR